MGRSNMTDEWFDQRAADIANQECDELLARLEARRRFQIEAERSAIDDGLVYKTVMNPPPRQAAMDDEFSREWNAWLQSHLEKFADVIGDEMGHARKQMRDEISTRIGALERRIDDLESRAADKTASVVALRGGRAS
jgi:hypothetical protein